MRRIVKNNRILLFGKIHSVSDFAPIMTSKINKQSLCCLPFGKVWELQILRCQGIAVADYNFTLDALALKPSGFCNVRVCKLRCHRAIWQGNWIIISSPQRHRERRVYYSFSFLLRGQKGKNRIPVQSEISIPVGYRKTFHALLMLLWQFYFLFVQGDCVF